MNNYSNLMPMSIQTMVKPSSWVDAGRIQIQTIRGFNLFKFTDDLQSRLEILLEKHKTNSLTEAEAAEFAGITKPDRIFTLLNARLLSKS